MQKISIDLCRLTEREKNEERKIDRANLDNYIK